jgi:uncharacterized membrane protein
MPESDKYRSGDDIPFMNGPPADPSAVQPAHRRRSRLWATIRALLRARVTAGLILVLPIWITYLLVKFIFDLMRDASLWVVNWYLSNWPAPPVPNWMVSIVSVVLTVFFLYVIGVLSANFFGRRLVLAAESLLDRVPFVKTIYRACKQILETFAGESAKKFQRVCLVPIPSAEVRSVGFLTATTRDAQTGEELCTVFLVIAPHPTAGYVFILKRSDVVELDWTMEDALRLVVSCGVIVPPSMPFASPTLAVNAAKPMRPVPVP